MNQTLIFITLREQIKEMLILLGPTICNSAKWFDNQESDQFVYSGAKCFLFFCFFFNLQKHMEFQAPQILISPKAVPLSQNSFKTTSWTRFLLIFFSQIFIASKQLSEMHIDKTNYGSLMYVNVRGHLSVFIIIGHRVY